jgi:hypothetical protein
MFRRVVVSNLGFHTGPYGLSFFQFPQSIEADGRTDSENKRGCLLSLLTHLLALLFGVINPVLG